MNSPQEWRRMTVGDLFDFVNGNGFKPSDWTTEGFPIIRIQNLNGSNNYNYYNGEIRKSWIVDPGQLLFAWAGTRGVSFGPHIWKGPKGVLNQHIYKLMPRIEGDNRWLYYILARVTEKIERKAHGFKSTLLHVQKSDIVNQVVAVPPKCEQKAIADLLSTWDEAIEKTEQLIQAKERRFQYLIRTLINDPNYPRCHIRDFTSECTIRNRQAQCERVLSVTNTNGFVLPEEQFKRRVASSDLSNYKLVTRGQYAYNPSRINVGSIARLDNWDKGVLSPMYIVFELDQSKVNSDFFMHWLTSHEARQRIRNSAQGSVRETVSFTDLGAIVFPVPDMERQSQAAEILNYARSEIDLLKNLADEYKAQKRGLMQKLLTGQWRVKEEAAA